jgi:LAO/AO transport system kinase
MNYEERIVKKIKSVSSDNKLSCEDAHRIAEELKIELWEIGRMADKMNIKIVKCMLGCF